MKKKGLCLSNTLRRTRNINGNIFFIFCTLVLMGSLITTALRAQAVGTSEKNGVSNTIKIAGVSAESLCTGSNINLQFSAKGYYRSSNVFLAQLSNAHGNFDYPTNIGAYAPAMGDQLFAQIPENIGAGNAYRVRIVSTNPTSISLVNNKDITIHEIPIAKISVQKPIVVSASNPVVLTASEGHFYVWSNGEQTRSISVTSSGKYAVNVANELGCASTALPVAVEGDDADLLHLYSPAVSRKISIGNERTSLQSFFSPNNTGKIISTYPNPAINHFSLLLNHAKQGRSKVQVMNSDGLVLFQKWIDVLSGYEIMPIQLSGHAAGVYMVKLINGTDIQTTKVILRG